jgi:hypothetical protein
MLTKITIYLTVDAVDSDYWDRQCFASWHGSEHFGHQISQRFPLLFFSCSTSSSSLPFKP